MLGFIASCTSRTASAIFLASPHEGPKRTLLKASLFTLHINIKFLRGDDTTKPLSSCWGKWRSWIIQIKVPKVLYNTGHKVPEKHVSTSNKYLWNVLKSSYCFPRRTTPSRDKYRDCVLHKFCFKTYLLFSVCEGFGQSSTAPLQLHLSFCIHLFPCPKYLLWASLREISI